MMVPLFKFTATAFCAALLLTFSFGAASQGYPFRPIRIVMPWAPGGSTDVLARLIGQKMTENLGQPALVENKPGASGNIGSDFVAKAPADGYTLLVGSVSTHAMNPFLISNMPFKGVDDFATVALAAYVTNVLVAHPSVPAKNVKDLIDLAESKPGAIVYASAGNGSTNHLSAELFRRMTATDMLPIDQFMRSVQAWPEVVACYSMTGDMDYLMRVQVADLEHYSRFVMDKLLKQAGALDVKSNFVLERVKDTTEIPLEHLS